LVSRLVDLHTLIHKLIELIIDPHRDEINPRINDIAEMAFCPLVVVLYPATVFVWDKATVLFGVFIWDLDAHAGHEDAWLHFISTHN
jgi:hypothetical protein